MMSVNPDPEGESSFYLEMIGVNDGFSGIGSSSEDLSKKIRKPYTITKSRESWTEQEHDKFLEALQLFDRDWKKIEAFVGSKTVIQIRSHAQKYFMKVQKSGTSEHVPPPRPKRKAAHPYPQKASKNVLVPSQLMEPYQSSSALLEPAYILKPDSGSMITNSNGSPAVSSWTQNTTAPVNVSSLSLTEDDVGSAGPAVLNNSCSSTESTPSKPSTCEKVNPGKQNQPRRVMPDFSQVYSFLGSVFDPSTTDHLQKLKEMDPVDVDTAVLLMRNLSVNLLSPDFEDHRKLLSSYELDSEKPKSGGAVLM